MSDFIYVILTAEGCGHCSHSRGDGLLGNGKEFLQHSFLNKLTKTNVTLLNIHFVSMSGDQDKVKDISKFTLKKDGSIMQERYFGKDGKTTVIVKTVDRNEKVKNIGVDRVKIDKKEIGWKDFIDKKISKKIENYTFYYPCFIMFRKKDWVEQKEFLGITNAGLIIKDKDGVVKLEKNPQTLNRRNLEPEKLLQDVLSGKEKFEVHKNLKDPEEKKVEKKEEKKVEKKQTKTNGCGYLIKNYDSE